MKTADAWPPANITYRSYYLKKGPTGSVKSLNDGALDTATPAADGGETVFNYPDPGWRAGVVTFGPQGPDTVARILTFTSAPLEDDLEVVGPIKLVLHAASSNTDTDFIVKLSEQFPQASTEQGKVQPRFRVVSKGWMKASHRELNKQLSTEYAPWYAHTKVEPLEPGKPYMFEVPVMPTANLFKKGSQSDWSWPTAIPPSPTSCSSISICRTRSARIRFFTRPRSPRRSCCRCSARNDDLGRMRK